MKAKIFVISSIALSLLAGSAQAAVSTATVQMLLRINSNTGACTVAPSAASFNLPNGTATQGLQDYLKAAGFTQKALGGGIAYIAGTTYDQTVSIACGQPNTNILSILVAPAVPKGIYTGVSNMPDSAGNPVAGGQLDTSAELSSITSQSGTAATPHLFQLNGAGTASPYTTPFMTTSALNAANQSTASFVWHPTMYGYANTALGIPAGGSYAVSWVVTVNY